MTDLDDEVQARINDAVNAVRVETDAKIAGVMSRHLADYHSSVPTGPTGPTGPVPTGPTGPTGPPPQGTRLEDFGAAGNGLSDDTAAIRRAIADGRPLLANGVYKYTDYIQWTRPGGVMAGMGKFIAANEEASSFALMGNQTLDGLTFVGTPTKRHDEWEKALVVLFGKGAKLNKVKSINSGQTAFFMYGAEDFLLENCVGVGSRADGFHSTGNHNGVKSKRGKIINCTVESAGDDCFSVVSYGDDPNGEGCADIEVINPTAANTPARMFTIAGGTNIRMLNVRGRNSGCAGVYIVSESKPQTGYNEVHTTNAYVSIAQIEEYNTRPEIDHGGVFFLAGTNRRVQAIVEGVGEGLLLNSKSKSRFHIGGYGSGVNGPAGTISAAVRNLTVRPNNAKDLIWRGSGATIADTNVKYG